MSNQWTARQYSLYRFIFGSYLSIHFFELIPWTPELFSRQGMLPNADASPFTQFFPNILGVWDFPSVTSGMAVLGMCSSIFFALGIWDRVSALTVWYILACFFGRNPLISNPSLPFMGWLLLAHLFVDPCRRKAGDPLKSLWQIHPWLYTGSWLILACAYSYSGITKLASPSWVDGNAMTFILQNPLARENFLVNFYLGLQPLFLKFMTWGGLGLEILFLPLTFFKCLRPWIWLGMALMHIQLILIINFTDLSLGMLMMHFFTLNPAWIRSKSKKKKWILFYDGDCGLCNRFIQFVLEEDRGLQPLLFSALQGKYIKTVIPEETLAKLPDSIVLLTEEGLIYVKSKAVFLVLKRLGGLWFFLGSFRILPAFLTDKIYDLIAYFRKIIFRQKISCPWMCSELKVRFLD